MICRGSSETRFGKAAARTEPSFGGKRRSKLFRKTRKGRLVVVIVVVVVVVVVVRSSGRPRPSWSCYVSWPATTAIRRVTSVGPATTAIRRVTSVGPATTAIRRVTSVGRLQLRFAVSTISMFCGRTDE